MLSANEKRTMLSWSLMGGWSLTRAETIMDQNFLLQIQGITAETHVPMPTRCLVNDKPISSKKTVPHSEKFPFIVPARDTIMLQYPGSQSVGDCLILHPLFHRINTFLYIFCSIICKMIAHRRLRAKKSFKELALKCPYHQNFYFPIRSYISCNKPWRKIFRFG